MQTEQYRKVLEEAKEIVNSFTSEEIDKAALDIVNNDKLQNFVAVNFGLFMEMATQQPIQDVEGLVRLFVTSSAVFYLIGKKEGAACRN